MPYTSRQTFPASSWSEPCTAGWTNGHTAYCTRVLTNICRLGRIQPKTGFHLHQEHGCAERDISSLALLSRGSPSLPSSPHHLLNDQTGSGATGSCPTAGGVGGANPECGAGSIYPKAHRPAASAGQDEGQRETTEPFETSGSVSQQRGEKIPFID